jgi:oligoribonuclease NrnB/cAMP/cGMP phosphodiesterase (DHH superfamily)
MPNWKQLVFLSLYNTSISSFHLLKNPSKSSSTHRIDGVIHSVTVPVNYEEKYSSYSLMKTETVAVFLTVVVPILRLDDS